MDTNYLQQYGITNEDIIIATDEVGRGALAGDLVVCAGYFGLETKLIDNLNDSKKLKANQRENIRLQIDSNKNNIIAIARRSAEEIDREQNILKSTLLCMAEATICVLEKIAPDILKNRRVFVVVDGNKKPDIISSKIHSIIAIPQGDGKVMEISAASIVAKTTRDKEMREIFHPLFPQYGWNENMGYGTALHLAAIAKFRPSILHRKTFLHKIYSRPHNTETMF